MSFAYRIYLFLYIFFSPHPPPLADKILEGACKKARPDATDLYPGYNELVRFSLSLLFDGPFVPGASTWEYLCAGDVFAIASTCKLWYEKAKIPLERDVYYLNPSEDMEWFSPRKALLNLDALMRDYSGKSYIGHESTNLEDLIEQIPASVTEICMEHFHHPPRPEDIPLSVTVLSRYNAGFVKFPKEFEKKASRLAASHARLEYPLYFDKVYLVELSICDRHAMHKHVTFPQTLVKLTVICTAPRAPRDMEPFIDAVGKCRNLEHLAWLGPPPNEPLEGLMGSVKVLEIGNRPTRFHSKVWWDYGPFADFRPPSGVDHLIVSGNVCAACLTLVRPLRVLEVTSFGTSGRSCSHAPTKDKPAITISLAKVDARTLVVRDSASCGLITGFPANVEKVDIGTRVAAVDVSNALNENTPREIVVRRKASSGGGDREWLAALEKIYSERIASCNGAETCYTFRVPFEHLKK